MSEYSKEEQAEHRQQWVQALRSGDYKQIGGSLRGPISNFEDEDTGEFGYCCLGVACELAVEAGVARREFSLYGSPENFWDDQRSTELPRSVAEWLGITSDGHLTEEVVYDDPDGSSRMVTETLIGLNDGAGFDFEQIADVIESGKVREVTYE